MVDVRFGLIGYGGWGSHHAAAIQHTEGARLTAITSRSDDTRERASLAHPEVAVHANLHEFLARDDLDVVCVVLPSDFHYAAAKLVLEAGHHLLLEKPMALQPDECHALIELASRQQKRLMIGHELRLSTLWGRIKELIDQGAIGEPLYANLDLWRRPLREGVEGWRHDPARVGSWILEEPIHYFDLARWYLAEVGEPISVYARSNSRHQAGAALHDNFSAVMSFPAEVYATLSFSAAAFEHHQSIRVNGSRGALWGSCSAQHERTYQPTCSLRWEHGGKVESIPLTGPSGALFELREEITMVVDVLRGRSRPPVSGYDGLWAVTMCRAAEASIAAGRVVPLEPLSVAVDWEEDLLTYTTRRRHAQRSVPAARTHDPTIPD